MNTICHKEFDGFAQRFVREYWDVVKKGTYPMPPNEPVDESLDELLNHISYTTECEPLDRQNDLVCNLRMTSKSGDWWHFLFKQENKSWKLIGCMANSGNAEKPNDLLGPVYAHWFKPFLEHVTEKAIKGI